MPYGGCSLRLVVLSVMCAAACGTSYQPRPSPRIELVIRHGSAWYVKDGQETAVGPLGGDLAPLVAGAPDAVFWARRARAQLSAGVPAYVAGAAAVVVGALLHKPAGWAVLGGGVAVGATGIVLMGAGFTNVVDAINIYNDTATIAPPRR